jgi:predicted PurR-regulated permease PerM
MASQVESLASNYSRYAEVLRESFPLLKDWFGNPFPASSGAIDSARVGGFFGSVFSTTVDVLHGFISLIAMLTIAFYLSIEEKGIRRFFSSVTPDRYQEYVISRAQIVYDKIGHWMLGQFFLMFAVFLSCLVLLLSLDVPYAFLLAFLTGILEVVPYIGPILSAIPAVLLGFTVSPFVGLLVLAGYIVIQQTESHVLVPQVMKRAVGLHPIVVILALLIGAKTGGVIGAILAVPVATGIGVFIKDAFDKKQDSMAGETPDPVSRP